jgi:hypothetical protein
VTTYLALVKVPANATADDVRRTVPEDLDMLASRLVTEYGIPADEVMRWFESATDVAYDDEPGADNARRD